MSTYSIRHGCRPPDCLRPLGVMLAAAVALCAVVCDAAAPAFVSLGGRGLLYGDVQGSPAGDDRSPFDDDDGVDAADEFGVDDVVPGAARMAVSLDRAQDGPDGRLRMRPRPHAARHAAHLGNPRSRRRLETAATLDVSRPVTGAALVAARAIRPPTARTRAMGRAAWRRTRSWLRRRGGDSLAIQRIGRHVSAHTLVAALPAAATASIPISRPPAPPPHACRADRRPRHRAEPRVVNRRRGFEDGG